MRPSEALRLHRQQIRGAVERSRARNPRIFGSVLRGEDAEGSDLDLLVDALPGATLLDMAGLQLELEELLGLRVDVLTPGDLPQRIRTRVLDEAQPLDLGLVPDTVRTSLPELEKQVRKLLLESPGDEPPAGSV